MTSGGKRGLHSHYGSGRKRWKRWRITKTWKWRQDCNSNIETVYKMGMNGFYFLRKLRYSNMCSRMLEMFSQSVVCSISFAVLCWGSSTWTGSSLVALWSLLKPRLRGEHRLNWCPSWTRISTLLSHSRQWGNFPDKGADEITPYNKSKKLCSHFCSSLFTLHLFHSFFLILLYKYV